MFYSHELLTNRQYGVATIWLVATLGSKSTLKKVTRKAILDVNVPKACDKITDPAAPLALRLQGSLLYGVSRVYSQQCMYVLADTHSFKDKMRGIQQIMKQLEIDEDIGKTNLHQLNLSDDPVFNPDFDMNFDLGDFGIFSDSNVSRASSILSGHTLGSSRSSLGPVKGDEEPGIDLPSMDTPGDFGGFDVALGSVANSAARPGSRAGIEAGNAAEFEESAVIDVPDFEFDDEFNLVPTAPGRPSDAPSVAGGLAVSESGASARVRAEHEAGIAEDQPLFGFDDDEGLIFGGDEEPAIPPAQPFYTTQPESEELSPADTQPRLSAHPSRESATTTTAEAPQRRARQPKRLRLDERAEISNRQLGEWSTNYLDNMDMLARTKEQRKSASRAKKNAAYWVLDQGIGGVETHFGDDHFAHPLSMFSGHNLLETLVGSDASPAGFKRGRSPSAEADDDEEGRRVRPRQGEEEMGRGEEAEVLGFDDDGIVIQDDEYNRDIESEVGRQAPSSMKDQSSAMPWNVSSRGGSAQRFGSAGLGMSSSAAGPAGLQFGPPSALSGRRSRLTSASPLGAKGPRLPSLAIYSDLGSADDEGMVLDADEETRPDGAASGDDFKLYGPSADVDTQTAVQSQWLKSALEDEAYNFLSFLETQIADWDGEEEDEGREREAKDDDAEARTKSIMLDELLPPAENSKVVGAQALLHVLSLTTWGLIRVEQADAFGDIEMSVVRQRDGGDEEAVEEQEETAE